jgi:hypothetical protein
MTFEISNIFQRTVCLIVSEKDDMPFFAESQKSLPAKEDGMKNRSSPLYHLTDSTRLVSIREAGLDPRMSREADFRERHIYLSADAGHASAYADHHGDWRGEPVLLRIMSGDLDQACLGPDDVDLPDILAQEGGRRDWRDFSWKRSLDRSGQCTCSAAIPADVIMFKRAGESEWTPLQGADLSWAGVPDETKGATLS